MKDEIKEILELYKNDDIEYYNLVSDLGYDKLLDYITNLQERIDKALEYCKESSLTIKSHFFSDLENILEGD